ncbi:hypothetical protein Scep_012486 [Stephania cephalantha]|uniref:Uncharacterized protein n=1 Tax=Stephania cephalantha TaxID=152367 RepID=A0AAP0JF88_9MAGN
MLNCNEILEVLRGAMMTADSHSEDSVLSRSHECDLNAQLKNKQRLDLTT